MKPNTYTQIHIQSVFAVKYRHGLITPNYQERLHKYISGIVNQNGHKMLSINSVEDHIHLFFGFRPTQSLSQLMQFVKGDSSEWINKNKLTLGTFNWQDSYAAFSYKKSDIPTVCTYIERQQEHHKKVTFLTEYKLLLEEFGIAYDEKYLFADPI